MRLIVTHVGQGRTGDRSIRVFVDNEERAEVACGDSARLEVATGSHSIRVENEWNISDTVLVDASGSDIHLESGLSRRGTSRSSTLWNGLWRGAELDLRPASAQELRVSILHRTKKSRASREFLRREFIGGTASEFKTLLWLVPLAMSAAAIWIVFRDLLA